jgi:hypothetical protein
MPTPQDIFLNEDITGNNQNNLVTNEEHVFSSKGLIIKPELCAYYTSSIIVKGVDSTDTEHLLIKNTDYTCTDLFETLSAKTGKEICASILLEPFINFTKFRITYQAFGGFNNPNTKVVLESILNGLQASHVDYNTIINKPTEFNPAAHLHDWLDLYGLEYIQTSLNNIQKAIENSPKLFQSKIGERVQAVFNKYKLNKSKLKIDTTHITNKLNIHRVTKKQIGLGNVQDLKTINDYIEYDGTNTSVASFYASFNQTPQKLYVTDTSANKYIGEYSKIVFDAFFSLNTVLFGWNGLDNWTTTLSMQQDNTWVDAEQLDTTEDPISEDVNTWAETTPINYQQLSVRSTLFQDITDTIDKSLYAIDQSNTLLDNQVSDKINASDLIKNNTLIWLKQYTLLEWNYELAKVVEAIFDKKYLTNQAYSSLIDVPNKLDDPYLWIDFSDTNTIASDVNGYINSITDKSSFSRSFIQNDQISKPSIILNSTSVPGKINYNQSASFTQGKHLINSSTPIRLYNDFTIIVLLKTKTSTNTLLSSTTVNDKLLNNATNRSISLLSDKFDVSSKVGTCNNDDTCVAILSVSDKFNEWSYSCSNDNSLPLLDSFIKKEKTYVEFDCIGDNNSSSTQNYEFSELIIYNRQLSKVELNALLKYFSMKWSGQMFNVDLSFIENMI